MPGLVPAFLVPVLLAPALRAAPGPGWDELEARGAVIREIRIEVGNVFDLADPKDNSLVGRVADAIHRPTRPWVIRELLLFKEGDRVQARVVRETERNLRAQAFLRDAEILPEPLEDGGVRAVVKVRDDWSLLAYTSFSTLGGQNRESATILERNLFGTGKTVGYTFAKDPVRTNRVIQFNDPRLLGSWWTLNGTYNKQSDGKTRTLNLALPFYSFATPWSAGIQTLDNDQGNGVVDRTQTVGSVQARVKTVNAWSAWSLGLEGDQVTRLGLWANLYQQRVESVSGDPTLGGALPPAEDKRVQGLGFQWVLAQDRFVQRRNFATIGRVEDLPSGWYVSATLDWNATFLGSTRDSPGIQLQVSRGWDLGPDAYASWAGTFQGRLEHGKGEQVLAANTLTGYDRLRSWQVLAGQLSWAAQRNPDLPAALNLGGTDGSRGYRNQLLAGDQRWLGVVEDRLITTVDFLGILRLGFVVYADAALIHRLENGGWSQVYPDVGGGLRLGDLKSSFGTIYSLTIAYPLRYDPLNDRYVVNVRGAATF
ncbi:MAG: hypothetical protein ABSH53_16155 [Holophaga sp.]